MGGGNEGRAMREEASKDMPRGTHLTAVYPALLQNFLVCNIRCKTKKVQTSFKSQSNLDTGFFTIALRI